MDRGSPRRPGGAPGMRPAAARRRRPAPHHSVASTRVRIAVGRAVLVVALVVAGLRLVQVQGLQAEELSVKAAGQRTTEQLLPAERGTITDRNGTPLAFSVAARSLYAMPNRIVAEQRRVVKDPDEHKKAMARRVAEVLGPLVTERDVLSKLHSDRTVVLLAPVVEPAQARALQQDFPEISDEHREVRRYPGGELAANVLGVANWRSDEQKVRGLVGLENHADTLLAGIDGSRVVDTAEGSDTVIPGSERAVRPPVPGSSLELTLDADLQYTVQQLSEDFARRHGARSTSVVVLDSRTGEVRAMANGETFDPNDLAEADPDHLGNPAVSAPFEPGSVNKIVTAAAAIEYGLVEPDSVLQVPGLIEIADRTVQDAWSHGTLEMTFTGVLAKSSNVGTLLTAQRVGEQRFVQMLERLGLGERTDVGLPGESGGRVPPREQWPGSWSAPQGPAVAWSRLVAAMLQEKARLYVFQWWLVTI